MTRCLARRSQKAESSAVVVIRSINGPWRFPEGRSAESADMSRALRQSRDRILRLGHGVTQTVAGTARPPFRLSGLSRSEVAHAPFRWPPGTRRHHQDNDAEPNHRQAHEFENQSVHGKIPQTNRQVCWEAIERRLISGALRCLARAMFSGG